MNIYRKIEPKILMLLREKRILFLSGPHQAGKEYILDNILMSHEQIRSVHMDARLPSDYHTLMDADDMHMAMRIGQATLVAVSHVDFLDNYEERIRHLIDQFPRIRWIFSCSSELHFVHEIPESAYVFLPPLVLSEFPYDRTTLTAKVEEFVLYGAYPHVMTLSSISEKQESLLSFTEEWLLSDLIRQEGAKKTFIYIRLLQILALEIGNVISFSAIAEELGMSTVTVQKYIRILEDFGIVFTLPGWHMHMEHELHKSPKIYFYDTGIRNAILGDFKPLDLRGDREALWGNWVIAETMKYARLFGGGSFYYWQTKFGHKIPLILEKRGHMYACDIRTRESKKTSREKFQKGYPFSTYVEITRKNCIDMLFGMEV